MKNTNTNGYKAFILKVILVLSVLFCFNLNNLFAQSGTVISTVIPSNNTPNNGDEITVDIEVDMSNMVSPDDLLGSFSGSLNWDPAVLDYVGNTGIQSGFTGVVNVDAGAGVISFNGANPTGTGNIFNILQITFNVIGSEGSSSILDLEYSAMAAAVTFANLLPFLTVNDGNVSVVGGGSGTVTSTVIPSNYTPNNGDEITVDIEVDMSNMVSPDDLLGSFSGSLNWDPAVLDYVGNTGIQSGFTGVVNVDAGAGVISFNGANPTGTGNIFNVLQITFIATGSSTLDLEYSAMAAALTFANLLPLLTVNDGSIVVGVDDETSPPGEYKVYQNYPNPFNPGTKIKYALPQSSSVRLTVYNTIGEVVEVLVNKVQEMGYHEINFYASNLPSGIYLYKLVANDFIEVKKMILLK